MAGNLAKILFPNSLPHKHGGWCRLADKLGGLSEVAKYIGPIMVSRGFTRVFCHNVGGIWTLFDFVEDGGTIREQRAHAYTNLGFGKTGTHTMHLNQWLLAEQAQMKWADRGELTLFHHLLVQDYGIKEVLYYLGGSHLVPFELGKLSLEPFMDLPQATFGFDAVYKPEDFPKSEPLWRWLKEQRPDTRIYTEGHPEIAVDTQWHGLIDGSIAVDPVSTWQQNLYDNVKARWEPLGHEVITIVDKEIVTIPDAQAVRHWGYHDHPI